MERSGNFAVGQAQEYAPNIVVRPIDKLMIWLVVVGEQASIAALDTLRLRVVLEEHGIRSGDSRI